MQIVADVLTDEVLNVYRNVQYHHWVKLQAAQYEPPLKVPRVTPGMPANINKELVLPYTGQPLFHPL